MGVDKNIFYTQLDFGFCSDILGSINFSLLFSSQTPYPILPIWIKATSRFINHYEFPALMINDQNGPNRVWNTITNVVTNFGDLKKKENGGISY